MALSKMEQKLPPYPECCPDAKLGAQRPVGSPSRERVNEAMNRRCGRPVQRFSRDSGRSPNRAQETRSGCATKKHKHATDETGSQETGGHARVFLKGFVRPLSFDPLVHPLAETPKKIERAHQSATPANGARDLASDLVKFANCAFRPMKQARTRE